jgi:hypothetical protein
LISPFRLNIITVEKQSGIAALFERYGGSRRQPFSATLFFRAENRLRYTPALKP